MFKRKAIIADKHRLDGVYSLNPDRDNFDQLVSEDVYVISPTGTYEISVTLDTAYFFTGTSARQAIFTTYESGAGLFSADYELSFYSDGGDGELVFWFRGGSTISYSGLLIDYPNQVVVITVGWSDTGHYIKVNGNTEASDANTLRPATTTRLLRFFAARTGVNKSVPFTGRVLGININDEHIWSFPEGSGYDTYSDTLRKMTLNTDNAGGLSYINSNVWIRI